MDLLAYVVPCDLAGTLLHAQIELLLEQVVQRLAQFFLGFLPQFTRFHHMIVRLTKVVSTGSFAEASLKASRASSSGTPSIS